MMKNNSTSISLLLALVFVLASCSDKGRDDLEVPASRSASESSDARTKNAQEEHQRAMESL